MGERIPAHLAGLSMSIAAAGMFGAAMPLKRKAAAPPKPDTKAARKASKRRAQKAARKKQRKTD